MVTEFVTQCFQTYPQYGDDAGGLTVKIKTFVVGLEDYTQDEITKSFREWLKTQKKMPVPADISELCRQYRSLSTGSHVVRRPRAEKSGVPWMGKTWKQIEAEGFIPQIEKHLIELTKEKGRERAAEYLNFLKNGPINQPIGAKS